MSMSTTQTFEASNYTGEFSLKPRLMLAAGLTAFLVLGVGLWSATARLDAAVIGAGSVLIESEIQNVQHMDGGTLSAILVRSGEKVVAGQPVLILDTFDLDTRIEMLKSQIHEAEARAARLGAERAGIAMQAQASFLSNDADARSIYAGELRMFEENSVRLEVEILSLGLQLDQLKFETIGLLAQQTAAKEEIELIKASYERLEKLQSSGSIEKSKLDEVQRDLSRMQGQLGELTAKLAGNETRKRELALEREQLMVTAKAEAHRDLRVLEPKLAELHQQLIASEEKKARAILRAPVSGVVNEVHVATIGEVVAPGKTLIAIVPDASDLVIEFRIATTDIDAIEPGQSARLRFPSFNQRLTPEIEGIVETIAAAAVTDPQTGMTYYTARAKATGDLAELGSSGLIPGMPVEIYIPTAERVVISYLVQPIIDQMQRGMREE